ncbi:hypothetical protein B0H14DRAFT_3755572 [Mycena olivaceomarginata]|nr:hypothetical protein B0H14DRAFT_3755572 [Mycena olivaceomarginata]
MLGFVLLLRRIHHTSCWPHVVPINELLVILFSLFAPTSMPECPGCGGTFTAGRALSVHVVRSTDVRCRQARSDTEALLSDSDEEFGPSFASDFPTGGGSFTGDFFGEDYAADDFDFGSDDSDADCKFVDWKFRGSPLPPIIENLNPGIIYERKLSMAKHPTHKSVKFNTLETEYGATFFRDALSRYIVGLTDPELTPAQIERESNSFDVPFNAVPVFQRIKFTAADPYAKEGPSDSIVDSVHVQPSKMAKNGDEIPARFDTVLVNTGNGGKTGTTGGPPLIFHCQYLTVRVIFSLPDRLARLIFPPNIIPPKHLAYVEWFSSFKPQPEQHHLMYRISRTIKDGDRFASIIPVDNIRRSIHLFPKFGAVAPVEWKSHNVLDRCPFSHALKSSRSLQSHPPLSHFIFSPGRPDHHNEAPRHYLTSAGFSQVCSNLRCFTRVALFSSIQASSSTKYPGFGFGFNEPSPAYQTQLQPGPNYCTYTSCPDPVPNLARTTHIPPWSSIARKLNLLTSIKNIKNRIFLSDVALRGVDFASWLAPNYLQLRSNCSREEAISGVRSQQRAAT